jgi:hypothetical protein
MAEMFENYQSMLPYWKYWWIIVVYNILYKNMSKGDNYLSKGVNF